MSEIMFPVGRMIGGSLYKAYPKTDNFGKPKLDAAGQPVTAFNFGVAIPKAGEAHWSQTPWGAQVAAIGQAAYPNVYQNKSFAWKIVDGDSVEPNKSGKKPCDQEGYKGCWIIWFNQGWAPTLVNENGSIHLTEPDSIVPGYFIQVYGSVKSNAPSPSPGVFMNPIAVARSAFGERIIIADVDTKTIGFGGGPLPAGATSTPPAGFVVPVAAQGFTQAAQGFPQAAPAANTAFLAMPPIPSAPPAAPRLPVKTMTESAGGATYEQMIGVGWNDDLLIQHGHMVVT